MDFFCFIFNSIDIEEVHSSAVGHINFGKCQIKGIRSMSFSMFIYKFQVSNKNYI